MNRFEELPSYRLALALQREIFSLSRGFPKEERFSLSYQIRKSSRAIGAKIAESWCKRQYPVHSLAKLSDASAECCKTRHWLQTCVDCDYLAHELFATLTERCLAIEEDLREMIREADGWRLRR